MMNFVFGCVSNSKISKNTHRLGFNGPIMNTECVNQSYAWNFNFKTQAQLNIFVLKFLLDNTIQCFE